MRLDSKQALINTVWVILFKTFMFPKSRRITKKEFETVLKQGRFFQSDLVQLRIFNERSMFPTKVAVVVSKKISKVAPIRNTIKRRLYEIFRVILHTNPSFQTGFLCIVFAKKPTSENSFQKILSDTTTFFQSIVKTMTQ